MRKNLQVIASIGEKVETPRNEYLKVVIRISYVQLRAGGRFAIRILPGTHNASIPEEKLVDAFWRLPTTGEFDKCPDGAFKMEYLTLDDDGRNYCNRFRIENGTRVFTLPPKRGYITIAFGFTALIRADNPTLWFTTPWPCEQVEYNLLSHPSNPIPAMVTLPEGQVSKRDGGSTTRVSLRKRVPKGFSVRFSW